MSSRAHLLLALAASGILAGAPACGGDRLADDRGEGGA